MATYTGQDGSLSIDGDAVANLRSWSVDYTVNTVESSVMTDSTRTFKQGIKEWSGSADIYYDNTVVGNLEDAITAGEVAFIGYPTDSGAGNPKVTGNILVTGISVTSSMEGMVEASVSFQGTGDVTFGTAA